MGLYLTIPDMVESEVLFSVSAAPDGVTFSVTMGLGDTATRLMTANVEGRHIPLVVLTTDSQIFALDSVYVTEVSLGGLQAAVAYVTFLAREVRFV